MTIDRVFLTWALGYVVLGMLLGIFMAMSQDHGQHVTHAHILLVGFVLSLVYGVIHKLWLEGGSGRFAKIQLYAHQAGAVAMSVGLFLLYGNFVATEIVDPLLGGASIAVLAAALMMFWMVVRERTASV